MERDEVFEVVTAVNEALLDFMQAYIVKIDEVFPLTIEGQDYMLQCASLAGGIKLHFTEQPTPKTHRCCIIVHI